MKLYHSTPRICCELQVWYVHEHIAMLKNLIASHFEKQSVKQCRWHNFELSDDRFCSSASILPTNFDVPSLHSVTLATPLSGALVLELGPVWLDLDLIWIGYGAPLADTQLLLYGRHRSLLLKYILVKICINFINNLWLNSEVSESVC